MSPLPQFLLGLREKPPGRNRLGKTGPRPFHKGLGEGRASPAVKWPPLSTQDCPFPDLSPSMRQFEPTFHKFTAIRLAREPDVRGELARARSSSMLTRCFPVRERSAQGAKVLELSERILAGALKIRPHVLRWGVLCHPASPEPPPGVRQSRASSPSDLRAPKSTGRGCDGTGGCRVAMAEWWLEADRCSAAPRRQLGPAATYPAQCGAVLCTTRKYNNFLHSHKKPPAPSLTQPTDPTPSPPSSPASLPAPRPPSSRPRASTPPRAVPRTARDSDVPARRAPASAAERAL